mgnify:CR=1 FL=1
MKTILLKADPIGEMEAELLLENAPKTCDALWNALPLTLNLSSWGHELYGNVPINPPAENPQEECEVGDLAYWLEGSGFCILYGKTPVSTSDKPRLISPGNVFGKLKGDASVFKGIGSLDVRVEKGSE